MGQLGKARVIVGAVALAAALVTGCSAAPAHQSAITPAASVPGAASGSPAADVQVITVSYAGGVITPPEGRVSVKVGQKVELRVTSDVAEIVHNHLNNVEHDVAAGGTVVFDFTADNPGIYEVELHKSNKLLLQLVVQ